MTERMEYIRICSVTLFLLLFLSVNAQFHDAEVVLKETKISIQRDKRLVEERFIIQINNHSGERYTKVSIPYSKMHKVSGITATLTDNTGKIIRKLRSNEISDRSYSTRAAFYSDQMLKEFTLKHHVYPYRIEYSYKMESSQFIDITSWYPFISSVIPCHKAMLQVLLPYDLKVSVYSRGIADYKHVSENKMNSHVWTGSYSKPIKDEILSPPGLELVPYVRVSPEKFYYEKSGNLKSWADFGDWVYSINQNAYDLGEHYSQRISSMIKGKEEPVEIVQILYEYLQKNTRYVNVSIETGGLKSYPASYVAQNRYGDCKALTVYMKAMLDMAGIPSFYTLVYADDNPLRVNLDFPAQQFNHVFLMVPMEKDTLWLECTGKGPAGYLGSFTQNRDVLVIDRNKSFFAKTPSLTKDEVSQERFITISQKPGVQAHASVKIINRGDRYNLFHYILNNFSKNDIDRIIKERFSLPEFEISEYNIGEADKSKAEILLSIHAQSINHFRRLGNHVVIKPTPFDLPSFESPSNRTLPVRINYPVYQTDTIIYHLSNFKPDISKLEADIMESRFGLFSCNYIGLEDGFMIAKKFLLHAGEYSLDEYHDFFEFIHKIRNFQNTHSIIINH